MHQTFKEFVVYDTRSDEEGVCITIKVETREPSPLLDELARRMEKPFWDKWRIKQIEEWLEQEWFNNLT